MQDGTSTNILINCCEGTSSFRQFIFKIVKNPSTSSQLGEILESLCSVKLDVLLVNLQKLVKDSVVDINNDAENIYAVIQVLGTFINKNIAPAEVVSILSAIHGSFLQFSDRNIFIQNSCSELFEKCWTKKLAGRDVFAVNVPSYLLARSLCPIGKAQDISRLNDIKEMLGIIDFQCLSSASLISLLCKAASDDQFLKNRQGVEFLSYILTLDGDLMVMINEAIKFVIPDLKDTQLLRVGEVYYGGIELAKERDCLAVYEKGCLQSLIVCALHCHRVGANKAAQNVSRVLSVLHKHAKEQLTEDLLYNLYKPLLWRALDAANGHVRANAASLFLNVFPLIPSHFNKVQFQDALEEQCSKIKELLMDDNAAVRVCTVHGCAQVLEDFWQILPAHHVTSLVTTLCCEMSHDMSSSEVVVAALQGIRLLLNNPLTHVVLKKLLPLLSNHIYHPAVSVRNVMISLLLTLHQTSIFKFWDLVPAEDLLSIVEHTRPGDVRDKIVSLLVHLYFPVDESLSVQIQITLDMLRKHSHVHRVFYLDAYPHVGLSPSLRLVVGLMTLIKECMDKSTITLCEASKVHISAGDTGKVAQVLEVCAVLVTAANKDMKRNELAGTTLCNKIVPLISKLLYQFGKDATCNEALSIIISNLPKEGLVPLKKQCYKMCKEKTVSVAVLTATSTALIRIGGGNKILSHWSDVMGCKLESIVGSGVVDPSGSTPVDVPSNNTTKILQTVSNILSSTECSTLLACTQLDTLYSTLFTTIDILPQYTHSNNECLRLRADHLKCLVDCMCLAARLSIHIGGVDDVVQIGECVKSVIDDTRSGNSIRSLLLNGVFPVMVEGFLVLQHSSSLLTLLYAISVSLGDSELSAHRLSVSKYLYRAAAFLGNHSNPGAVDLRVLLARVLKSGVPGGSRKELKDVECLLLEVAVTARKQELRKSRGRPWDGVVDDILQVVIQSLDGAAEIVSRSDLSPLLQVILDCIEISDTFACLLLPVLQTTALHNEGVTQFTNLITL